MSKYQDLVDVVMDSLLYEHPWEGNVKMLVDNLIANGVTIQRWIPVTERLPKLFENVLVFEARHQEVTMAYKTRDSWTGVVMNGTVTHWMPLPTPPKL